MKPFNLLIGDARRRDELWANLYRHFVSPGDLVFDIGACMGARVYPLILCSDKVVAVETQLDCVAHLRHHFHKSNVSVVLSAVGEIVGKGKVRRAKVQDPMATMSELFINRTTSSGRFIARRAWSDVLNVDIITLDEIINRFGLPAFIKIDVNGLENLVLNGLTRSVKALSFAWIPELPEIAAACLTRCEELGLSHFHISFLEGARLSHRQSISRGELESLLRSLREDAFVFGDVYASCQPILRS